MLKKSLIAIATLGAFAGSAMAADITISGRIDTGLNFHDQEVKAFGEKMVDQNEFKMKSGQYSGSRITIKGSEELGNGMKAGFILENGFEGDDGSFDSNGDDKLFGRESIVYLEGDFGHFSMGRVGSLSSGLGSYNLMYNFTPWGTGWGDFAGNKGEFMLGDRGRMNNTITYRSPEFAGVQVFAQYSLEAAAQEDDQSGNNKRYAGLGASYKLGAFSTALVVDTIMNGAKDDSRNTEDSLGVSWGASFDLGVTKPMVLVQYGKNENKLGGFSFASMLEDYADTDAQKYGSTRNGGLKGYAVALGAVTPLLGGNLYTSVNYTDGKLDGDAYRAKIKAGGTLDKEEGFATADIERWGFAAGYDYPLSKRTKLYGYAAFNQGELKGTFHDPKGAAQKSGKSTEKDTEVGFGMVHFF